MHTLHNCTKTEVKIYRLLKHVFGSCKGEGDYQRLTVLMGWALLPVLGSLDHPVTVLDVYGVLAADGESSSRDEDPSSLSWKRSVQVGGLGGGSGGSLLLFLQTMILGDGSLLSTAGGEGGAVGGGGGAGGRVHFHWSDIPTGEDYVPIASGAGLIDIRFFYHLRFLLAFLLSLLFGFVEYHLDFIFNYDVSVPCSS